MVVFSILSSEAWYSTPFLCTIALHLPGRLASALCLTQQAYGTRLGAVSGAYRCSGRPQQHQRCTVDGRMGAQHGHADQRLACKAACA